MLRTSALLALLLASLWSGEAPFIDSKAIKERFASITKEDMDLLRSKKILFASRSFGQNLNKGLAALAKQDAKYQILGSFKSYDVFKAGGDTSIVLPDSFEKAAFVHFYCTYWPHSKRIEEMDKVLHPPQDFGKIADVVIIFFHTALPDVFTLYASKMDAWRAEFPKTRFIYVTAAFMGPKQAKLNESAHLFSEKVRERYRGKVPVYDLGAILSDDFRVGHVYCPEYSQDPADVHPNLPAGEAMMAKGFLLVLRDAFRMESSGEVLPALPPATGKAVAVAKPETLPADHPEAKAVRAILDANGLTAKQVNGVAVVRKGHVVELFLQEGGVTELPDAIGALTELERLHIYGDRNLKHPLLKSLSPAISRCVKLQELLLNSNDLTTLPAEIVQLEQLKTLSLADNRLRDLPPAVVAWAKRFDAKGLALQLAP